MTEGRQDTEANSRLIPDQTDGHALSSTQRKIQTKSWVNHSWEKAVRNGISGFP